MSRIVVNKWSPLTCSCELLIQYDADLGWDGGVTILNTFTNSSGQTYTTTRCADHSVLTLNQSHAAIWDEHQRKEIVRAYLLANVSALAQTKTNLDGSTYLDFKDGISFLVTFTGTGASRVVNITIQGAPNGTITDTIRNAVYNFLTNKKPAWANRVVIS